MAPPRKNDALSQFSKLSPTMKLLLLIVVMALAFLIYWQFVFSDLRAERKSEKESNQSLQSLHISLSKRVDKLVDLKKERDRLAKHAASSEFALPTDPEINAFLDDLQTKAGATHVTFKSWKQGKDYAVGKFRKMPLQVTVEGTFYNLLQYLSLLGPPVKKEDAADETAKYDRPCTVENLNLSEAAIHNDEIVLQATFTAAAFYQEAPAPPPGAKPPGAAKPAPAKPTPAKPAAPKTGSSFETPKGTINRVTNGAKANTKRGEKFVKDNIDHATGKGAN